MKMFFNKIARLIQRIILTRRGWLLQDNVVISIHDVRKIGGGRIYCSENVNINTGSLLIASADIRIGKNSTLAYRTLLTTNANPNAPYNKLCNLYPPVHKEIVIGDNVWIGVNAVVLPGVTIGNNVIVAAGAVVNSDIPDNVMVAGVPAKIKKKIVLDYDS